MFKTKFNYGRKKWGTGEVDLRPQFLGATRLKYCLKALQEVPEGKLLEIGCGGGAFSRAIKKHYKLLEVVGCDLISEVLAMAQKKNGGVAYQQANVYHLPFKDTSFQAVVSFDVWEHLEKPKVAFKEVWRVLKPGGIFHFFVPTEGNRLSLFQLLPSRFYSIKKEYTGHVQAYTKESLLSLLTQTGFKVKKTEYSCFYFYQLIDLSFFTWLKLSGKNASFSVEGYLELAHGNINDKLLQALKDLFGWLTYTENEMFKLLPGGGIHVTAIK